MCWAQNADKNAGQARFQWTHIELMGDKEIVAVCIEPIDLWILCQQIMPRNRRRNISLASMDQRRLRYVHSWDLASGINAGCFRYRIISSNMAGV